MSFHVDDTIVAVASAVGGALRGIVRISGPNVQQILSKCFRSSGDTRLAKHKWAVAIPGEIQLDPPLGKVTCDLYLWPTDRSYTRQPCAEVHAIGSPPLLEAIVKAACDSGARLAGPGEFTMRSFLAGRLDLTQAEAVLGVIDASDRTELDVALSQLAGGLATPLNHLRDQLLDLLAHLEAGLDFVEEDIEFISAGELSQHLGEASREIEQITDRMSRRGERAGEFRVAIVGAPNVGKSSLFNAIVGDSAAIVAEGEGTTRDYVSCRINLEGVTCLVIDTAGFALQETNSVAAAAQEMTTKQADQSQLSLFCVDSTRPLNDLECRQLASESTSKRLIVLTKVDAGFATDYVGQAIETSSRTRAGMTCLRLEIAGHASSTVRRGSDIVAGTAVRCRESLRLAAICLDRARELSEHQLGEELVATELRAALDELGKVVGAVYTDDVLDRVFSTFCIGK